MGQCTLALQATKRSSHPLNLETGIGSHVRYDGYQGVSICTTQYEVHGVACYSTNLMDIKECTPYVSRRLPIPRHMDATSTMYLTHLDLRCHITGGGVTLHDTVVGTQAYLCPRYPIKKSGPVVKKKSQSISEDQLGKNIKRKKKKEGPQWWYGVERQCSAGNTPVG